MQAAVELYLRAAAELALYALAVIADLLDDIVEPRRVEAEALAETGGDAKVALDSRVLAFQHLVDILRGDAELLGFLHAHQGPFDHLVPLVVALAHHRDERLDRKSTRLNSSH